MNWTKKIIAAGLALMMTVGLAACNTGADTSWIAKRGEETIPAGLYLSFLMNQYYEQVGKLPTDEEGNAPKKPLGQSIDGKKVSDLIVEGARSNLNEFLAIESKFLELGLELAPEETAMIEQQIEMYWGVLQELYLQNGISKESYMVQDYNALKRDALFKSIYGENGSEAVPAEEIAEKFYTDYAKVLVIPLSFAAEEDADKASKDQTARDKIEEFYKMVESGTDMEDAVFQARKITSENPDTLTQPEKGTSYTFISRDQPIYEENVVEAVFNAEVGKPFKVESEYSAYLFVKYDIKENPADVEAYKNSITRALRQDAFDAKLAEWAAQLSDVTINEAAIKRYTPSKLKLD